ncbi:DegT/DnrJ/EryC1/StrS family aminotransferase [Geomonas azotofigens]|uniref:DegT/DnrJ/EryC1/StrS family aminotransferase n=1 Tax=Geomonas azotofigens TaxID=2843196 RepID=UPI001C101852|nr:DegT/DnrJ/EryC1/StrS family aminotransferase [Geomonas azotofigens]MBU5613373.1 DegT/DnrJ/EryC1/StrS family aminotransferase [Geomonas azotofigens]
MIKLIKPYISFEEVETEFREVFESGWFTRGRFVTSFAEEIARYTGARHAFLATSATTALWLCLKLLEIGPGDEVVVSDFSFPATANVVEDLGATPVFADVSPDTFNMLPAQLASKVSPRTKAVIFVDALGNPAGLHEIRSICRERGIPLVEDAACAIGSSERGVRCGAIADLTCFSFHPRKLLTTGEGGAITTGDAAWAERLAVKLSHGSVIKDGKFDFVDYGYNFRLSELQAVMGIKQLAKLDAIVASRNAIRAAYIEELAGTGFIEQKGAPDVVHNVQSLVFRVPRGVDRDALIVHLKGEGVEATLGTYCLSGTTYYQKKYGAPQPNAWQLQQETLTLPCFEGVDVGAVCRALRSFL